VEYCLELYPLYLKFSQYLFEEYLHFVFSFSVLIGFVLAEHMCMEWTLNLLNSLGTKIMYEQTQHSAGSCSGVPVEIIRLTVP